MTKQDIYQEVTDKIISVLDAVDFEDFQAPFAGLAAQGMPLNPVTENHYGGINIPSLWCDQQAKGFASNQWATFKQWKQKGAQVRKGEQASPIIFYKSWNKEQENDQGEKENITIPVMRFYSVFNAAQVDGYVASADETSGEVDLVERIATVDRFCARTGADVRHGECSAFYNRKHDYINMPETIRFRETDYATATENYYAVLLHELTHWTGAPKRLARDKAQSKAELKKYAFEELIAELGAAFLCSRLKITQTPRKTHAAYIKNWLQAMRGDKKFIFKASAQAARAAQYLETFQNT